MMKSSPEASPSLERSPAPEADSHERDVPDDSSRTPEDSSRTPADSSRSPVATPTSTTSPAPPVSPPFPTHSYYLNPVQIKTEPVEDPPEVFPRPRSPLNIKTENSHDVTNPSDSIKNPTIYINPSILLSKQRANYPGPGTPMPLLSPSAYPYPFWDHSLTKNIPRHLQRPRRHSRSEKNSSRRERTLVNIPSKDDKQNLMKNVKNPDFYIRGINNNFRRCRDARDWLNEKAARGMTGNKSQRFVDRGTSPINFSPERTGQVSKDIALSPIRCIEPFGRCKSSVNVKPSGSKLGCKRSGMPEGKSEMIKLLKHACERCDAEGFGEGTMGCPNCQDHAAQEVVH